MCSDPKLPVKEKIDPQKFYDDLLKAYPIRGKTAMGYWAYFTQGRSDCMPAQSVRTLKWITKMMKKYSLDKDEMIKILMGNSLQNRKTVPTKKKEKLEQREQELTQHIKINEGMGIFD